MSELDPNKLTVTYLEDISSGDPIIPRAYTLTHSDTTGDLFLTIGTVHNKSQISGWYTRLMRDEVLAEWQFVNEPSFHVHCHVSGGIVLGTAKWRYSIFRQHMPMVLEAFRYGDRKLFEAHPDLDRSTIYVHFHSDKNQYNHIEEWGQFSKFRIEINQYEHDAEEN
ncbi:MAG TPA: staygreen family protein [Anaerolineales bacterium]|nr:staygreen family protein [Anaerolineales bacterium]